MKPPAQASIAAVRCDPSSKGVIFMKIRNTEDRNSENGGGGSYLLLWLLGVPIPVLAIIFLLKGCN